MKTIQWSLFLIRCHVHFKSHYQIQPSESAQDVKDIALNLVRLRNVYNLSVSQMLSGNIRERVSPFRLNVQDCLRIAEQSYEDLDLEGTLPVYV